MSLITEQRKMLLSESLAVKLFFLNQKRKRNPVQQIYKDRFKFSEFHHLYTQCYEHRREVDTPTCSYRLQTSIIFLQIICKNLQH